jgi:hypothetical protein
MSAVTKRILGQLAPGAGQEDLLYQVPAGCYAELRALVMCNRSGVDEAVSVRVSPDGEDLGTRHYVYDGLVVKANDMGSAEHAIEIGPGDKIHVRSAGGGVSFSLFGREMTAE